MSERFWITGVQLGLLTIAKKSKRQELVDEIVDKQFIGNYKTDKEQKKFKEAMEKFDEILEG